MPITDYTLLVTACEGDTRLNCVMLQGHPTAEAKQSSLCKKAFGTAEFRVYCIVTGRTVHTDVLARLVASWARGDGIWQPRNFTDMLTVPPRKVKDGRGRAVWTW